MTNVKTAYPLDISGKIEGEKGNKEAELVFYDYSWLQNIFGMYKR